MKASTHSCEAFLASAEISPERRAAIAKLLADLDGWMAPRRLEAPDPKDVAAFMAAKLEAGFQPNTVRKWLVITRSFYGWLHRHGGISAETLLAIKAIPMPDGQIWPPVRERRAQLTQLAL